MSSLWLILAGAFSAIAAALHLAIIVGGPQWYRFFGAGEGMARAAERRSWRPAVITLAIAAVLLVWAAYGFAGAGLIPRLPLMRTALAAISAVYLLRGLLVVPMLVLRRPRPTAFWIVSSLVVLAVGVTYAIGTVTAWGHLSAETS
jgi:hypothetical protein